MSDQFHVQPGTLFAGDFRVVRAMRAGGMGAVYVAEQISTGKSRAVKVMLPQLVADPTLRKRFEQEARIGSLIESEHVVEVVGAGVDPATGLPWLAMELLSGEDLSQVVARRGALPVPEVLAVFEQLCHAVGAAHTVGVVHRDLKPENIYLAQARRAGATFMVKVLDFGIAKIVAEASTKVTAAMGSPIWMAPEQADQSPITPATDVWALGLIAFYLLTGRSFWKSGNDDRATVPQVLKEVLFEPIVPASVRARDLDRELPTGFDAWFARCVSRDATTRFETAAHAWGALAALAGAFAGVSASPSPGGTGSVGTDPTRLPGAMPAVLPVSAYASSMFQSPAPSLPPVNPSTGSASSPFMPGPRSDHAAGRNLAAETGVAGSYTVDPSLLPPTFTQPTHSQKVPLSKAAAAFVVLGVLAFGSAAVAIWVTKHPTTALVAAPPSVPASSGASADVSPDMSVVLDAKRLCDEGKCDTAHQKLSLLPPGSDARQSPEFKSAEYKWATETLLLAERATDVATKRSRLASIVESPGVDEAVRATARDELAMLDASGPDAGTAPDLVVRPAAPSHAEPARPQAAVPHPQTAPPPSPSAIVIAPAPPPAPSPPPAEAAPQRSVYDLANSSNSTDWWIARRMLEPKLQAGTATLDELKLLNQICRNQHDSTCVKTTKRAMSAAARAQH